MGLASKVQNAGGASALSSSTATASAAAASGQSTSYPQINQGVPNGMSQRPALPGPSGQIQSGSQGFPGPQPSAARPSLTPQLSFQPQQQQQRPMLQQSASFQGHPGMQGQSQQSQFGMQGQGQQGQFGMQGQGQQGGPQRFGQQGISPGYGQPGMSQGFGQSPSFNPNSYGPGAQYNQLQLTAPQSRPSAPPMQNQYAPRPGTGNVQPGLQQKLESMIRTNRLEAFYPAQKLQQVLQRLSNIDFTCVTHSSLHLHKHDHNIALVVALR